MCVPKGGVRNREPAGTNQKPRPPTQLDYTEADFKMNTEMERGMWDDAGIAEEYPFHGHKDYYPQDDEDDPSQSDFSLDDAEWSGMTELSALEEILANGATADESVTTTTTAEDWDNAVFFRDTSHLDDYDYHETGGESYSAHLIDFLEPKKAKKEEFRNTTEKCAEYQLPMVGDERNDLMMLTYDVRSVEPHDTILLGFSNNGGIFTEKMQTVDLGEVAILDHRDLFKKKRRPDGMCGDLLYELHKMTAGNKLAVHTVAEAYDNLYVDVAENIMDHCFKITWPEQNEGDNKGYNKGKGKQEAKKATKEVKKPAKKGGDSEKNTESAKEQEEEEEGKRSKAESKAESKASGHMEADDE